LPLVSNTGVAPSAHAFSVMAGTGGEPCGPLSSLYDVLQGPVRRQIETIDNVRLGVKTGSGKAALSVPSSDCEIGKPDIVRRPAVMRRYAAWMAVTE
jgi:hypothetical protein